VGLVGQGWKKNSLDFKRYNLLIHAIKVFEIISIHSSRIVQICMVEFDKKKFFHWCPKKWQFSTISAQNVS